MRRQECINCRLGLINFAASCPAHQPLEIGDFNRVDHFRSARAQSSNGHAGSISDRAWRWTKLRLLRLGVAYRQTSQAPSGIETDAGFTGNVFWTSSVNGFTIRPIGEVGRGRRRPGRRKARRWVVERTLAWLSKCRALLVRYDKHDENYLGLIQLACGLLWYRRLHRLGAA